MITFTDKTRPPPTLCASLTRGDSKFAVRTVRGRKKAQNEPESDRKRHAFEVENARRCRNDEPVTDGSYLFGYPRESEISDNPSIFFNFLKNEGKNNNYESETRPVFIPNLKEVFELVF
ncbi:hypothetical protein AVEN_273416-1 [Araneus ventricosus]|uniref:Uncharacterized protein n=1 Tax=Araneus ventricosus TaxID=182803 RepID=A0A4Y2E0Q0_ARAVE|nr:hypothetical protein AVEN_273416-1 [Araneus ventricosus]